MQYLIIEHFKKNKTRELYQRFNKKGRMLPDGVKYIKRTLMFMPMQRLKRDGLNLT